MGPRARHQHDCLKPAVPDMSSMGTGLKFLSFELQTRNHDESVFEIIF